MTTDILAGLPSQITRLTVAASGDVAGRLSQPGQYSFQYINQKHDVSLTMPHREEPYHYGALHPVFSQNLPEGYLRRYISEKLRRYANVNDMYLLALMGDKGVGHLSYHSDIALPEPEPISLEKVLHWSSKQKLFPKLLERYYLSGMASGVQPKVLVSRSTILQQDVIIKTFDEEFPLLTVNEFVCMKCAEHCGLDTPKVWLSDNLEHYIIERFDTDEQGKVGVEDFATLMGRTGDQKYIGSYENILKATMANTDSLQEVERAFRLIAFNCLIGNGDVHLKNFSLQYDAAMTDIKLSPVYDVTHTLIYPAIDNNMALKMRKSKAFPSRRELVEFGFASGISRSVARKTIDEIADKIRDCLTGLNEAQEMPGLHDSIMKHLATVMDVKAFVPVYRHDKKRKYT